MPPIQHDAADNWRALADQLTPRQVERLARVEQRLALLPADQRAAALLAGARAHAAQNGVTA